MKVMGVDIEGNKIILGSPCLRYILCRISGQGEAALSGAKRLLAQRITKNLRA